MHDLKDEELMLAYQKGDGLAMTEILKRYKNPVYRFAIRVSGDASEAEDIAQEVFLRVHQSRDAYRPAGKFSTWLFAIAHNLSVSRLRRKKWLALWPVQDQESREPREFQSPEPSPLDNAVRDEDEKLVRSCVKSLPLLQKEALVLREYEGLDYDEIGKVLKKSRGAVKLLLFRARENLKTRLAIHMKEGAR